MYWLGKVCICEVRKLLFRRVLSDDEYPPGKEPCPPFDDFVAVSEGKQEVLFCAADAVLSDPETEPCLSHTESAALPPPKLVLATGEGLLLLDADFA